MEWLISLALLVAAPRSTAIYATTEAISVAAGMERARRGLCGGGGQRGHRIGNAMTSEKYLTN